MPDAVPFMARKVMQEAIFEMFKTENEWTTWSDSVALAEAAARALEDRGFVVVRDFLPPHRSESSPGGRPVLTSPTDPPGYDGGRADGD